MTANGAAITRQNFGIIANISSTPVVAQANLFDITNFQIPDNLNNFLVASSAIAYYQSSNGLVNGTTTYSITQLNNTGTSTTANVQQSTNPTPPPPSAASSTFTCAPPTGATDIGGGIAWGFCSVINYLFVPPPSVLQTTGADLAQFQNVLPFSIFVGIIQDFNVSAASSSQNVTDSGWSLPLPDFHGGYTSLVVFGSSTIASVAGTSTVPNYFGIVRAGLWGGTALLLLLH